LTSTFLQQQQGIGVERCLFSNQHQSSKILTIISPAAQIHFCFWQFIQSGNQYPHQIDLTELSIRYFFPDSTMVSC